MTSTTVAITGISGFVGAATAVHFLQKGYNVRGIVRSESKAKAFEKLYPQYKDQLSWAVVTDMTAPGAFDTALQGVDLVAHIASPFTYDIKDNEKDMLVPAVEGTVGLLRSAAKIPQIKTVALMSSFAAILDYHKMPRVGYNYDEKDWNPATWEEAAASTDIPFVYCASKGFAEKAAWDYFEAEKPHYTLTAINPPLILGPSMQPVDSMEQLGESMEQAWQALNAKEVPFQGFPVYIDVRDVAKIIDLTFQHPEVANKKRYLTVAGHFVWENFLTVAAKEFPDQAHRMPKFDPNFQMYSHFTTDSSMVERELGITWTPFETMARDMATDLYAKEAALRH